MKIKKFLLLGLCVTIFSCSQEDVTVSSDTPSSFHLKSNELSQKDVDDLRSQSELISQSTEFLTMRANAKAFGDMLNNIDDAWNNRSELELWLNNNLTDTQYNTVADALADFDALEVNTQAFNKKNDAFFVGLSGGSPRQIQYITEPINAAPVVSVDSDIFCYFECLGTFLTRVGDIEEMFTADMQYDAYVSNSNSNHVGSAEVHRSMRMEGALGALSFCMGNC